MRYAVEFTRGAEDDLVQLYDFLLERAKTLEELDVADEAVKFIRDAALSHLSTTPYSYRKVGIRSTLRKLIIPFGTTGHILRFDIRSPNWCSSSAHAISASKISLTSPGGRQVQAGRCHLAIITETRFRLARGKVTHEFTSFDGDHRMRAGRAFCLALALRQISLDALAEGLAFVELTTDPAHLASRRVIESNGGVLHERFVKPAQFGGADGLGYRIVIGFFQTTSWKSIGPYGRRLRTFGLGFSSMKCNTP